MAEREQLKTVEVFFYGLFMDADLLRAQGVVPMQARRAFVEGFALRIGKRATLQPQAGSRAYGMLMTLTHEQVARLYDAPGLEGYRPEAVLAAVIDGETVPALCYNLTDVPDPADRDPEYARQLKGVLERLGFPAGYCEGVVR